MTEPFTDEEIEEAIGLFLKEEKECTKAERIKRSDYLARLELSTNSKKFLERLKIMAQPRDIP